MRKIRLNDGGRKKEKGMLAKGKKGKENKHKKKRRIDVLRMKGKGRRIGKFE